MIGLVIVSHSAGLAAGVLELAGQMAQGRVPMAAAGGAGDPENPLGTDAFKVLEAIEQVEGGDGALVLMDLGSALLSAETALELLDEARRARVRLCAAPLVEGAVAAVGRALAGGSLDEVAQEAMGALAAKAAQLEPGAPAPSAAPGAPVSSPASEARATLRNPLGLHARPAAQLVREAARHAAHITLHNLTTGRGPADATSINGVLGLGARGGHELAIAAQGPGAAEAVRALAALVESGFGEAGEVAPPSTPLRAAPAGGSELAGLPASPGVAVGPIVRLRPAEPVASAPAGDPTSERSRLEEALSAAREETRELAAWAGAHLGAAEAAIFEAQQLFLDDPALAGAACERIEQGAAAGAAWQVAVDEAAESLRALGDPYLQARAADVADVGGRVLTCLLGTGAPAPHLTGPAIVAARDLAPSQIRQLGASAKGVILEAGAAGGHSAILARALGMPMVVGLGPALAALPEGTLVALDGEQGLLWPAPDAAQMAALEARRSAWLERRRVRTASAGPAATMDGRRVHLLANIAGLSDVAPALQWGAEGVGVLRTEFLFQGRSEPPGDEEQRAAYRAIAEALGPRPLVIRTLDAGGDKPLPFLDLAPEANPFLGRRGIRALLAQPALLETQLRAILRAGAGREIQVMFPMVAAIDELRAARAILSEAQAGLRRAGAAQPARLQVGIMIEVPAAAALAERLAAEVDFFSIGTNDLSQYVMAADRTNPRVAALADALHPAVLRTVAGVVRAARAAGIGAALCGELAADPLAAPLLVGMGLEELSMNAVAIPDVKETLARLTVPAAEAALAAALEMDTAADVRRYLQSLA